MQDTADYLGNSKNEIIPVHHSRHFRRNSRCLKSVISCFTLQVSFDLPFYTIALALIQVDPGRHEEGFYTTQHFLQGDYDAWYFEYGIYVS